MTNYHGQKLLTADDKNYTTIKGSNSMSNKTTLAFLTIAYLSISNNMLYAKDQITIQSPKILALTECKNSQANHFWALNDQKMLDDSVLKPASTSENWAWSGFIQIGPIDTTPSPPLKLKRLKGGLMEYKEKGKLTALTPYCLYAFKLNHKTI